MLEWGDQIEFLQDVAEPGSAAEARLADRPMLREHLRFIWSAFWAMTNDRTCGQGFVGRIPFIVVDRYADRYSITGIDEFERFRSLISSMDNAYVDAVMKKIGTRN